MGSLIFSQRAIQTTIVKSRGLTEVFTEMYDLIGDLTFLKINYCQPRSPYCSPFCAEQVFTKNKPRNVFNTYTSFVFSSATWLKLRSQSTVAIEPTSEGEDGRDRTRRKSQSGHAVLFMVGVFALSSPGD